MKNYRDILILLFIVLLGLCGALFYWHLQWGLIAAGLSLFSLLFCFLRLRTINAKQERQMNRVATENRDAARRIISEVSVPAMILQDSGRILWRNKAMKDLFVGKTVQAVLPNFSPGSALAQQLQYHGSTYQMMQMPLVRPSANTRLIFQYWLDRTEAVHYQRLYAEQMPYCMLIYIDNFGERTSDSQVSSTTVLAQAEQLIADLCARLGAIYRRAGTGHYFCAIAAKQLEELEAEKFTVLQEARKIETGNGGFLSLSIAVGMANSLTESEEAARSAMELALGRGGDQAVVKSGTDYRFYGGKRQLDSNRSRVRARQFARALHQLFENGGDVFIMGHKYSDMDCIGAALGIAACAMHVGKRVSIVLDGPNPTISDALEHMEREGLSRKLVKTPEQAASQLRGNSVLVVVDTQRASTTVAPDFITRCNHIAVIDHHRRNTDYIEGATLYYTESRASSASEMVTEIMQYFDDALRPTAFTCSALLAGITVDTKQFAFNTGGRTFEAAGYLRRNGADLATVKLMFQYDLDGYLACGEVVKRAEVRDSGIAVSDCGEVPDTKILAARAADALLDIRGVQAAFVLGYENGVVNISGRSYGSINVQIILEGLGGGGHLNMAGAQLRDQSMAEVRAALIQSIAVYEANGES